MAKRKGRRIIVIAETKKIDRETIREVCETMHSLQGMIVFDNYFDKFKDKVDFLHTLGHQKYTSYREMVKVCEKFSLVQKAAYVAATFSLVFVICPAQDIELLYQDLIKITDDIVTLN